MKKFSLLLFLFVGACAKTGTDEASQFGGPSQSELLNRLKEVSAYERVQMIVQEKCINCHTGFHRSWAKNLQKSISKRIKPGDPIRSSLYCRTDPNCSRRSLMPLNSSPLSDIERTYIRDYILSLEQTDPDPVPPPVLKKVSFVDLKKTVLDVSCAKCHGDPSQNTEGFDPPLYTYDQVKEKIELVIDRVQTAKDMPPEWDDEAVFPSEKQRSLFFQWKEGGFLP
ncbi:MAG: hypothetical protein CL678_04795 [Bdellovibrionaceae bacterium]|nr:hypothetical protein [Pseudobdellovibrionaceae bacterium]|tara:strand:- start:1420 stop:2094 length:675 start_codon:yes stop_codon:yes gene_type:complete